MLTLGQSSNTMLLRASNRVWGIKGVQDGQCLVLPCILSSENESETTKMNSYRAILTTFALVILSAVSLTQACSSTHNGVGDARRAIDILDGPGVDGRYRNSVVRRGLTSSL